MVTLLLGEYIFGMIGMLKREEAKFWIFCCIPSWEGDFSCPWGVFVPCTSSFSSALVDGTTAVSSGCGMLSAASRRC